MATSSMDSTVKVWDLRTWKCLTTHKLPRGASHIQFSQQGKLATAYDNVVELWKDPQDPELCTGKKLQLEETFVTEKQIFFPSQLLYNFLLTYSPV